MGERVGFVTRGEAGSTDWEAPTLGMGMLGHAFMGKAHTNAYKTLDYIYTSLPGMRQISKSVVVGGQPLVYPSPFIAVY